MVTHKDLATLRGKFADGGIRAVFAWARAKGGSPIDVVDNLEEDPVVLEYLRGHTTAWDVFALIVALWSERGEGGSGGDPVLALVFNSDGVLLQEEVDYRFEDRFEEGFRLDHLTSLGDIALRHAVLTVVIHKPYGFEVHEITSGEVLPRSLFGP